MLPALLRSGGEDRFGSLPPPARDSVPPEATRFVGRSRELGALRRWTAAGEQVVSIVGPAGIGKTRLSFRHALEARVWLSPEGGVHFCDLADGRDVEDLGVAVARALGLELRNPAEAATVIERALAARGPTLLVLDNLDPLLPEAAEVVGRWAVTAPDARLVVTSRRTLGIPGERVLDLLPLRVPRTVAEPEWTEAVELFVDRVRAARDGWDPTVADLRAVAEIVRELNGIPLAIELAAARMSATDPGRLLPTLQRHLELLAEPDGPRPRQMTMGQAVDWSWGLLEPWEQSGMEQLSIFRGGFTLAAADAIVSLGPDAPPLDSVVRSLAGRSLVRPEASLGNEPERFAMYESIRAFAAERLRSSGGERAVAERHAEFFQGAALRIGGGPETPADRDVRERENFQTALELAVAEEQADRALHVAIALDVLSGGGGLGRAASALLDAALAMVTPASDLALVGRALGVRASTLRRQGRMAEAAQDGKTALALAVEHRDRAQAAAMRRGLGEALFGLGDHPGALSEYERALDLERALGNRGAEALVLQQLGAVHQSLGRREDARARYQEALSLAMKIQDPRAEVRAAMGLGSYWLEMEDLDAARVCYEHARDIARRMDMDRSERVIEAYLGVLFLDQGDLVQAGAHLERAVDAARIAGDVQVEGLFRAVLGSVRASDDRIDEATGCFEASDVLLAENAFFREVARLHRGHLDLALARRALSEGRPDESDRRRRLVRARIEAARLRVPVSGYSILDRSDDARIAIRILERALGV